MKVAETIFVLILISVITAAGNVVSVNANFFDSLQAMAVLCVICIVGYFISKIPGFHKLPVIFWVSIVAALVSSPIFPGNELVIKWTDQVSLLVVCTPILAYAGLAIGKDLALFKRISWRIIPVSLAVFSGTFLLAALIAQVTLHWDGVI